MTITLTPEQEQIVDDQLRLGVYRTPEDVVADALRALRKVNPHANGGGADQQEAVSEMLRFVENHRTALTGISVKDLIHEGHHL
jgi:Arc/MetJ-type ribon-helix-helix transcriptional regulator